MSESGRTRVGFIGLGAMARHHLSEMLDRADTEVTALCEPAPDAYAAAAELFLRRGLPVPPHQPDWGRVVARPPPLGTGAGFIITPPLPPFTPATAILGAGPHGCPRK